MSKVAVGAERVLRSSDRPLLLAPRRVASSKHELRLDVGTDILSITGAPPKALARLFTALDGRTTLAEAAACANLPLSAAAGVVKRLIAEGACALSTADSAASLAGAAFADVLAAYYVKWNATLFNHPLWHFLQEGKADTSLLDAWLVETYHFIRGANARLAYAVSLARTSNIKQVLLGHYVEEFDHFRFFAEALRRRGMDPEVIEKVGPGAGTLAVINDARARARSGDLHYIACSGLLESTGTDTDRARAFYERIRDRYTLECDDFVEPMLTHISLDRDLQHGDLMRTAFALVPQLTSEEGKAILVSVAGFVDTLKLWFDDILYSAAQKQHCRTTVLALPSGQQGGRSLKYIWAPSAIVTAEGCNLVVETATEVLRFSGASAQLVTQLHAAPGELCDLAERVRRCGAALPAAQHCLSLLVEAGGVCDVGSLWTGADASEAVDAVRSFAMYWNASFMRTRFFSSLQSGTLTVAQFLGWGIEFLHFVRAANDYMARGIARWDYPTHLIAPLWDHYVSECRHSEIFERGLIAAGLDTRRLHASLAMAGTRALINFFHETATGNLVEYLSIFALMRPVAGPIPKAEIAAKYANLSAKYPEAIAMIDAFREHDELDTELGHGRLLIEPMLRSFGQVTAPTMRSIWRVMERAAAQFEQLGRCIFHDYRDPVSVHFGQVDRRLSAPV